MCIESEFLFVVGIHFVFPCCDPVSGRKTSSIYLLSYPEDGDDDDDDDDL